MKSTLDKEVGITNRRRDGNTTRQIDYAIQWLLRGELVELIDHGAKNTKETQKILCEKILRRLNQEHFHVRRGGRMPILENVGGDCFKLTKI